ncbi:MAG: PilZ domain-containing protein [Candidatus Methylomirabilales bacterium]
MGVMRQAESRQAPRLPLRIPVRCESAAVPGYRTLGLTRNVSRSGVLVEAPRLVARGTVTNLRLLMGDRVTRAEAVVVWSTGSSPGLMGLKLIGMAGTDSDAWEELLTFQGGPTPRASLRIPVDLEITCLVPPDTSLAGHLKNLSDGGLLVILPQAVPPRMCLSVAVPVWLALPPVEAKVVWNRAGPERNGVFHGLRILTDEMGQELFLIGTILRSFIG